MSVLPPPPPAATENPDDTPFTRWLRGIVPWLDWRSGGATNPDAAHALVILDDTPAERWFMARRRITVGVRRDRIEAGDCASEAWMVSVTVGWGPERPDYNEAPPGSVTVVVAREGSKGDPAPALRVLTAHDDRAAFVSWALTEACDLLGVVAGQMETR